MAIYDPNQIARNPQSVYPEQVVDGQNADRVEPLLTPDKLVERYLFGIPLVSQIKNPMTGRPDVKTPDALKDHIVRALQYVEQQIGIDIQPVQREEQIAFDRIAMEQYGYFRARRKPILSIDELAIVPANNEDEINIYTLPKEWISLTHANKGQINIVPVVAATSEVFTQVATANGAAFLLSFIRQLPWAPSYWRLTYTSGFPEGKLPVWLNEIIGCRAAMDILSDLAATFRVASYSLGIDGISQSQSTPGPQVYRVKMQELQEKYDKLFKKAKALYGVKLATSWI